MYHFYVTREHQYNIWIVQLTLCSMKIFFSLLGNLKQTIYLFITSIKNAEGFCEGFILIIFDSLHWKTKMRQRNFKLF